MILWSILAFVALCVVFQVVNWRQRCWLRNRNPHPKLWQNAYVTEDQRMRVDEALGWICDAFLLPNKYLHALRPSDRLGTIYQVQNPGYSDSMDMEYLWDVLEWADHNPRILQRDDVTVRDLVVLHAGFPKGQKEVQLGPTNNLRA